MLLGTPRCDFGTAAPDFDLATPTGARYTRSALMGENGLLVAFICNHCPYVVAQIDRLASDAKDLQLARIGVVFIMSNDYTEHPADAPDMMDAFAQKHRFTAPYLIDEDQTVARAYGAVCTPDFFGYDAKGGLQYRGRLDNLGMRGDQAGRVPELINAMQQIAATGQTSLPQSAAMGCSIKWR
tara:strand:+ start:2258 stop:2806 length:549 start_codon:yes stop_codon:yes gene_type:complete